MKIPTIGQSRGIFEIFVPGAFLLLNIVGVLCLFLNVKIADILCPKGGTNVNIIGLSLVVLICFGYLIGMILRLLMTAIPDNLSEWYHWNFNKKIFRKASLTSEILKKLGKDEKLPGPVLEKLEEMKGNRYRNNKKFERVLRKKLIKEKASQHIEIILNYANDGNESWAKDKFPYIGLIGNTVKEDLPTSVYKFYQQVWEPMNKNSKGNKRFFNFCKTLMNKKDNVIMHEIYAAESTNRYISGMFYSLSVSFILILITLISPVGREYAAFLSSLLAFYFIAIWGIVSRFRFIRYKETAIVFDATYQNKGLFLCEKVDHKRSSY